ncbi:MAG: phosphatidylglycerophosphatase A [Candidatus Omnitrophota bacterium]
MKNVTRLVTSCFGLGKIPIAPGTFGSLGGVAVYFVVKNNTAVYGAAIALLFALGMIFSGRAEKESGANDPGNVVIDEASGMLTCLFLLPYSILLVAAGFLIFRVLDIMKPPPCRAIEKQGGSWGIMGDDLIAAIYTNLILQIIFRVFLA